MRSELPPQAQINYDGESREFKRSGSALYVTFLLALVIVFLVLAAQFESFRHPFIIMMTVPLAVTGALLGLWFTSGSINVFSQIGCIMLIGLAAKNGILIVEFANQLRDRGVEFVEAVIEAAAIRLRPVLMTSLCTVFGADAAADRLGCGRGEPQGHRRGGRLRRDVLAAADAVRRAGRVRLRRTQHALAGVHQPADRAAARSPTKPKPAPDESALTSPYRTIKKPAGGDTLPALVPSVRFNGTLSQEDVE